jgi:hypothetical protein
MSKINLTNQAAPSTPSAGTTEIYVDQSDKHLKIKDDTGLVSDLLATSTAITALTGEVTASGPGSAAATVSNAAVLAKVLTGFAPVAGAVTATDTILQAFGKLSNNEKRIAYGNASDGDAVIAVNTTLVRDMYYNNLEIQAGATLFTAGYRIHVAGTFSGAGTIDRSGTDATGTAATTALAVGTLGGSGAGGTAAGSTGGAASPGIGGAGGTGGATGSAGGTAGAVTVPAATVGGVEVLNAWRQAAIARDLGNTVLVGGAGGGGGAGDGTAGGAGGAGGGVVVVAAKVITFTGLITVQGGDGFQPTAGNRGGGAGGGGGAIILISEQDLTTLPFTTNVAGGTGASGFGTGGSGANGSNGRLVKVRI